MNPIHEYKNSKYNILSEIMEPRKVDANSSILLVPSRQLLHIGRIWCMSLGFATENDAHVANMEKKVLSLGAV